MRRRRGRDHPRASSATRPGSRPSATSSPGSPKQAVPPEVHEQARRDGIDVHARPRARRGAPPAGRVRPARARLVERQSLDPRRRRPQRAARRRDARDAARPTSTGRCSSRRRSGRGAIIESLEAAGVAVDRVVACGGLPERNALLMQLSADITGREFDVAASTQAPAAGLGDVRRGRGRRGGAAATTRSRRPRRRWPGRTPGPTARTPATRARTTGCTASTSALHDYFGRGGNDVMKRLRAIRDEAAAAGRAGRPPRPVQRRRAAPSTGGRSATA